MKKTQVKIRNPFANSAWNKKGGPHQDKRDKRYRKYPKKVTEE